MASLFGFEIRRKPETTESFVPKEEIDGAVVVAPTGGAYGTYLDLDGTVRSEAELITRYRDMSNHPELDAAIDEIVNDSIVSDEADNVNILLDDIPLDEKVKFTIIEEFSEAKRLLDFNNKAYDIFRKWYVDGRLYFHAIVDQAAPQEGIQELRYIDPRKIRKVREVVKVPPVQFQDKTGPNFPEPIVQRTVNEYFIYNDRGYAVATRSVTAPTSGIKIAKDAVVHVPSGVTDPGGTMVLSYLHKAIKPLNQLRTLEDAVVIYRLSRAPERRVWYVDIGGLPKMKAEQYVRDLMVKHKNKVVYDQSSGELRDDRKFLTMLEDYWLPRRDGTRGTEVTTLPAGQNLGQMDDVLYFMKKLYNSLNVPVDRIDGEALFNFGQTGAVSREEVKFAKFIARLRNKFCSLFLDILEKNLVLKNICTIEDWEAMKPLIRFDFAKDNYFSELKEIELLNVRLQTLMAIQPFIGMYYSHAYIRKYILKQSEELIEEMDMEIQDEMFNMQYMPPPMEGDQGGGPPGEDEPPPPSPQQQMQAQKQYSRTQQIKGKSPEHLQQLKQSTETLSKK